MKILRRRGRISDPHIGFCSQPKEAFTAVLKTAEDFKRD